MLFGQCNVGVDPGFVQLLMQLRYFSKGELGDVHPLLERDRGQEFQKVHIEVRRVVKVLNILIQQQTNNSSTIRADRDISAAQTLVEKRTLSNNIPPCQFHICPVVENCF